MKGRPMKRENASIKVVVGSTTKFTIGENLNVKKIKQKKSVEHKVIALLMEIEHYMRGEIYSVGIGNVRFNH